MTKVLFVYLFLGSCSCIIHTFQEDKLYSVSIYDLKTGNGACIGEGGGVILWDYGTRDRSILGTTMWSRVWLLLMSWFLSSL